MKNDKSQILLSLRAIILKEDKVLLIKRALNDSWNPGKWEFPGGKVDFGEDLNEALKREIKEETGLDVSIKEPLFFWDNPASIKKYEGLTHVILFFECSTLINSKVKLSKEHTGFMWLTLEELKSSRFETTSQVKEVLSKL